MAFLGLKLPDINLIELNTEFVIAGMIPDLDVRTDADAIQISIDDLEALLDQGTLAWTPVICPIHQHHQVGELAQLSRVINAAVGEVHSFQPSSESVARTKANSVKLAIQELLTTFNELEADPDSSSISKIKTLLLEFQTYQSVVNQLVIEGVLYTKANFAIDRRSLY